MDRKSEKQQFKYIDIAFGGLNKRNNLILASNLEKSFKEHSSRKKPTDCFVTYFRYPEEMKEYFVSNKNSVKDYPGPVYTDTIPIDIDNKEDLSRAHENAKKAVRMLEERGIDPNVLQIVFSGYKGFHLDIPSNLFGVEPSSYLNDVLKQMVHQMLPDIPIDPVNYDKVRLWRKPNSINSKSGLYCIPLSVHELLNLSIEEIKILAKNPRNCTTYWDDATELNQGLHSFYLEIEQNIHKNRGNHTAVRAALTSEDINKKCEFMKHAHQNPSLPEPLWYAMISNLSRLIGGPSLCQEYSLHHPHYNQHEVNEKTLQALNNSGPHTCQWIKENGFSCEHNCGVKSPIVKIQRQERAEAKAENSDQSSLHERIKKLSRLSPYDAIKDILKEISSKEELERNLLISALVEKTKITRKQLQAEVRRYREEELELNDNTVIIHPAYDIHESSINLGFKITRILDDTPISQNVYLVFLNGEWQIHTAGVVELNGRKGVFDLRDRELLLLNDRWGIDQLKAFVENPSSPTGVYRTIRDTLKNFVEFSHPAVYGLTAAWIIGTYFHRLFNAFPFLFIYGLKRTGKSRFEDVLEQLCMSAYKTRSVSVASLADTLDGTRGTFILDQAEILSQKLYADLLGILADSYTVGGGKRRIVVISNSGTRRVVEFETYGPKVFASTKDIDADLKDRCIEIVMARAEREYPYPERTLPLWGYLRDQLYRLLLTRWKEAQEIYLQAGQEMVQRVRELWRPLDTILILENVDEDEREEIKEYFLRSMEETQAEVSDLQRQLVTAIWGLLDGKREKDITATEIRDKLALPETEKFTKAKQAQWVGSIIRKLDLYDKKLKRDNNRRPYLFTRQKVADIAHRFGISLEDDSQEEFLHEEDEVVQGELL